MYGSSGSASPIAVPTEGWHEVLLTEGVPNSAELTVNAVVVGPCVQAVPMVLDHAPWTPPSQVLVGENRTDPLQTPVGLPHVHVAQFRVSSTDPWRTNRSA